jgi:hypothetical protein
MQVDTATPFASPLPFAPTHAAAAMITKLPDYFPTYPPPCKPQAEAFFACFEEHAVMKHAKDTESPRTALSHCQESLVQYMKCYETETKRAEKPWWKVW